jgi:hypothetical protein
MLHILYISFKHKYVMQHILYISFNTNMSCCTFFISASTQICHAAHSLYQLQTQICHAAHSLYQLQHKYVMQHILYISFKHKAFFTETAGCICWRGFRQEHTQRRRIQRSEVRFRNIGVEDRIRMYVDIFFTRSLLTFCWILSQTRQCSPLWLERRFLQKYIWPVLSKRDIPASEVVLFARLGLFTTNIQCFSERRA